MPVLTGATDYPADILEDLEKQGVCVEKVDALSLAEQAGSAKAVNTVLLARLSKYLPIERENGKRPLPQASSRSLWP